MIIIPDIATLSGDQRKDDGKTNRPSRGNGAQWRWIIPLADLRVR